MAQQVQWKKRLASALAAGFLVCNTAGVWAAPVELSLQDSINMALQNNPSIKVSGADLSKAEWQVKEAENNKKPALSLTHTSTHVQTADGSVSGGADGKLHNLPSLSVSGEKYENQLKLTVPLYTGNKIESAIDQAKWGLKAADVGVEKTRQQVRLDATSGYFGVLQARNMVKVSQESVDMLQQHLKNVEAQFSVGTVAKSDVLRSEVELANAQQALIKAQNAYDLAVSSLNNVIGLPLETELKVQEEMQYQPYATTLEDSISFAMQHRPDVLQADYAIEAAKAGVTNAESGNKLNVGAFGTMGWSDVDFPGTDNRNWSVGVQATWNVFDSGVTNAKVKQADSGLVKAVQQAKQAKDGVQLEVRQAFLSMKEAEKRIETTQVAVAKAEEDFKIAQVRYSAGVGTNIDVIDAQVALTNAKTNYIQALYDYNTSKAKLDKAMGVGIEAAK